MFFGLLLMMERAPLFECFVCFFLFLFWFWGFGFSFIAGEEVKRGGLFFVFGVFTFLESVNSGVESEDNNIFGPLLWA